MLKKISIILSILCICTSCTSKEANLTERMEIQRSILKDNQVQELNIIPQDLNFFLSENSNKPLLSLSDIEDMYTRFQMNLYAPWENTRVRMNIKQLEKNFNQDMGYAENYLPWDSERWESMQENADIETFPNTKRKAITISTTNIRELPTNSPRFSNPKSEGDAYPFDLFQYSSLPIGQPLSVIHTSQDKMWHYVETTQVSGWILASTIAFVDTKFIQAWKKASLYAFTKEDISLVYKEEFLAKASIGTVLPLAKKRGKSIFVYVPVKNLDSESARMIAVEVQTNDIEALPREITEEKIAYLANQIIGQPYGWGGMHGNRDCSAFMRDIFLSFGIWMPRNSLAQSKVGAITNLKELDIKEKKDTILQNAIPFLSFVYLPGHIGLYVGEFENEPVILHNVWGVRAKNNGRIIIGRTVISSLEPARENKRLDKEANYIHRIASFNTLQNNFIEEKK